MSMLWIAVIAASVLSFAQKWIGYQAPQDVLEGPRVSRITTLLPVALLGALVATQAAASGTEIVLDARLAGLAAAVVLLVLRAPFLVVVGGAAVVRAGASSQSRSTGPWNGPVLAGSCAQPRCSVMARRVAILAPLRSRSAS